MTRAPMEAIRASRSHSEGGRAVLEPGSRIQYLPGVGPQRALAFERLGIHTVEQLLRHYPRSYLDARRFVRIAELPSAGLVTVTGTVRHAAAQRTRSGRTDF